MSRRDLASYAAGKCAPKASMRCASRGRDSQRYVEFGDPRSTGGAIRHHPQIDKLSLLGEIERLTIFPTTIGSGFPRCANQTAWGCRLRSAAALNFVLGLHLLFQELN